MSLQTVITYNAANELSFDTLKVEVSGGLVRLKDLGGATYATDNPTVETQSRLLATVLSSFAHTASQPAGSNVKYQLIIGNTPYYFNTLTSLWAEATGAVYAQSNTQTEINANLGTLFSGLSIVQSIFVRVRIFLNSNGTALPSVTSNTWGYSMLYLSPAAIAECEISCNLADLLGADYIPPADKPVTLYVKNDRSFMHGSKLILPFTKKVVFDSDGHAAISIIETETVAEFLEFFILYYENNTLRTIRFVEAQVPNAPSRTLDQISRVLTVDWS